MLRFQLWCAERSVSVRRTELHPIVLATIVTAKRFCHPIVSKLCEKQLHLYSPHSQDKKKDTGGRPTKMPLTVVAEVGITCGHRAHTYPL